MYPKFRAKKGQKKALPWSAFVLYQQRKEPRAYSPDWAGYFLSQALQPSYPVRMTKITRSFLCDMDN